MDWFCTHKYWHDEFTPLTDESGETIGALCLKCGTDYDIHRAAMEAAKDGARWVPTWLELGNSNRWISRAIDPPFNEASFIEVPDIMSLYVRLHQCSWRLGQSFYLSDLCFLQQSDGGDGWLVIRRAVEFETISVHGFDTRELWQWVRAAQRATDKQLRELRYMDVAPGIRTPYGK